MSDIETEYCRKHHCEYMPEFEDCPECHDEIQAYFDSGIARRLDK